MDVKPGYKKTEVGVIPEAWDCMTINQLGDPVRGGSPRPAGDSRFFNGGFIPWLTVAAITNIPDEQLRVISTNSMLTKAGSLRSRRLAPGDLLIANSGATLGVAKVLGIDCCANDGIAAVLNLDQRVDALFLAYFINTRTTHLREVVATGNGQPNLNTGLIGGMSVPLPPLPEQRAIASALSDVDAVIAQLDRLIAKKRDLRQAAMQQLLTGKIRLPGFSGDWEVKKLGDLGTFMKGSGIRKDEAKSGAIPCVRYGEIYTDYSDWIRSFKSRISRSVAVTSTRLEQGDLLFAGSGETKAEIGKCVAFLSVFEAYAGGDIVILRPHAGGDSKFLGYYMNIPSVVAQKASKGQGDAVVHINASALASVGVLIPSLLEQSAIAQVLSDMDAEIVALEARRDKSRSLKQGMMQELMTGRIRLV